ncbi:MAG: hypothetical protein ACK559_42230, partial [bacterium]
LNQKDEGVHRGVMVEEIDRALAPEQILLLQGPLPLPEKVRLKLQETQQLQGFESVARDVYGWGQDS